ncbi:MAG: MBL fold metallo-hydrolase [Lachnospiraceae bacterium]|nr:MBL fold metallo-hydrolase [Lachnospiraceae bacterium]
MKHNKRGRSAASAHYFVIGLLALCALFFTILIVILLVTKSSKDVPSDGSKEDQAIGVSQETESEQNEPDIVEETEPEAADADERQDEVLSDSFAYRAPDRLYVHFIDVGQGDATLFIQGDHTMLVDTGSASSAAAASTRDLLKYLEELGVDHLDYLVLTHGHEDHVGRAMDVMQSFEIDQLIADFGNAEGYVTNTMERAEHIGLKTMKPEGGEELPLGDAKVQILTGRVTTIPSSGDETTDVNNQSIGLRVTYGENSFLLYGDGESEYEKYLLASGYKLKSDVLKVPHHGFEASLSDEILEKIHPKYAVISSAKKSNFGFPSDATLQKLGLAEVATFCTNRLGNVVAVADGNSITWSTNDIGK